MTISSSLNASVAGLQSNATRLAAISDNIANSSTYGYKRVTTDFNSIVTSSSAATYSAGGVRASTQRLIDQRGSITATENSTDLAVRGRGMLPVAREAEVSLGNGDMQMHLVTTGSFRPDADGILRSESGLVLLGWPALSDGTIPNYPRDASSALEPIKINKTGYSVDPTTDISLVVNLPAEESTAGSSGASEMLSVEYWDNLGTAHSITIEFTPTVPATGASNEWTAVFRDSASGNAVIGEYVLTFDDSRTSGGTLASVTTVLGGAYDPATGSMIMNVAGGPMEIEIGMIGAPGGMTQLTDSFAPVSVTKNGAPVGNVITSIEVDANGFVRAVFNTGNVSTIYQIPLVDVPNPNGMISLDRQTYLPSPNSGPVFLWDAGDGPTGDIVSFAREESTTDVAGELTNMIQTQRAYSSNAKVIQTVDEMLQETTNIKR